MDSGVLESKILEWAVTHNMQLAKHQERPWGSYEPILSRDGQNWWHSGEVVGWGFSEGQVLIRLFTKYLHDGTMRQWLGPDRTAELESLLAAPAPPLALPAE